LPRAPHRSQGIDPHMARAWCAVGLGLLLLDCSSGRDKWIADLQSSRPEQRANAVRSLAERFSDDDLVLYTQAARDPSALVRAEAVGAIGKSSNPGVLDHLGEALADPDEVVQARAAMSLAAARNDKARSYLSLQYGRRGRTTRILIVQALKAANVPGAMASVVAAEASSLWERNIKALQSGALPERVGAAEELGVAGRPEAVNRLVPLLKDNQVVLASAAARGLGYAGDARAVPGLVALLDENFPELREAACEALARLGDPAATEKLLAVALERSPASPLAVSALVSLPRSTAADQALCATVEGGRPSESQVAGRELRRRGGCSLEPIEEKLKSPATAAAGLWAASALGPPAASLSPKIQPLLASSSPQLRQLAAEALAELGNESAAPAVLKAWQAEFEALEPLRGDWVPGPLPEQYGRGFDPKLPLPANDPAATVRMQMGDLLRRVDTLKTEKLAQQGKVMLEVRPPREVVDDASDEQLRGLVALVRAIGRLRITGALPKLEELTRESSVPLRAAAYASLAGLGGESTKRAQAGLYDAERSVQSATATALAESGEDGQGLVVEALGQLGGDRTRLLEALRGQKLPSVALPTLLKVVKAGGGEAGLAALLIGDMKEASAVPSLLAALEDPVCVAKRELIIAIGRLNDSSAAAGLGRFLYSETAEVRAVAAEALANLGTGPHLEALDALKGDYSLRVRDAATSALRKWQPETKH
jgi:HEAT repeat protein